ncbi:pimeloyl-ACP methyl ester carboxylesterase [Ureibacillus xyleni]|uniref:Pimeloyl-ACP methyl ester carboxylesterase n=1 Tax=Ureibacillus xyleni TaxID=614648 RepID=A0A285SSP4_9BACL|nr:alpha/beta hydrolase [Ureibacillus xyleni]SOC11047.1 pimeloyl-ACP methyl ester carboxylesterase [Ureibacillus xyleni]
MNSLRREVYIFSKDGMQVEYSIVGKGKPILIFHGGHSNCNEEFGYKELVENGFSIITPTRPGYGNTTPIETLDAACSLYVDLLDHLNVEKVHVIAISAGGPSGITFTSLNPSRVLSLTLQSAVTRKWLTTKDKEYKAAQIIFRPGVEKYTWKLISLLSNLLPKFIFKQMASSFSKLPYSQIVTNIDNHDLVAFRKMNNRQRSGSGFLIDLSQTALFSMANLNPIECPTLIVHSKNDSSVPIEHAYYAQKSMKNSKLCILDTWGHLIWLGKGSNQVHDELLKFLSTIK